MSKTTVKLGEDHKNLEVFGTLICFTNFFQFSLCFRNCEGCVMGGVHARKTSVWEPQSVGPHSKKRPWLHIKRLANDCTFIGFKLM